MIEKEITTSHVCQHQINILAKSKSLVKKKKKKKERSNFEELGFFLITQNTEILDKLISVCNSLNICY